MFVKLYPGLLVRTRGSARAGRRPTPGERRSFPVCGSPFAATEG